MNKTVDYSKATPDLVRQVIDVIADADKHKYSVSKVYAAHNAAFGLREQPQTCSSCLRNRVRDLRKWLDGHTASVKDENPVDDKTLTGTSENPIEGKGISSVVISPPPQYDTPEAPGYVGQAEGTVRYPMAEGIPFDFLPNEGTLVKGTVLYADGLKVKPGTYVTADGLEIAVQPGGKASIKEVEEDLT